MNVDKAVELLEYEVTNWAMLGDGVKYNSAQIISAMATVKDWVYTHTIITEKLKKDIKFYQYALNPGSNPDDDE
jgi:hypothetical protein